jgi:hypothetical protein
LGALAGVGSDTLSTNRASTPAQAGPRGSSASGAGGTPNARAVRRRWRSLASLYAALFVVFVATAVYFNRRHTTWRQIDALTAEVVARAHATGSLPASLSELGWRLPPIFGHRGPVDPWGNPFRYRVLEGGQRFEISAGDFVRVSDVPPAPHGSATPAR